MAKKKAAGAITSVSEHIRNAWDQDRSAKPVNIVEQLKGQGVKTNSGTVATILSQYRKKLGLAPLRGKKRRKTKIQASANGAVPVGNSGPSVANVIEAMKLVTKAKELVGGEGLRDLIKAV